MARPMSRNEPAEQSNLKQDAQGQADETERREQQITGMDLI